MEPFCFGAIKTSPRRPRGSQRKPLLRIFADTRGSQACRQNLATDDTDFGLIRTDRIWCRLDPVKCEWTSLGIKATFAVSVAASIGVKLGLSVAFIAIGAFMENSIKKVSVWCGVAFLRRPGWSSSTPFERQCWKSGKNRSPEERGEVQLLPSAPDLF